MLTGDKTQFADLGSGVREESQEILWGGTDSIATRSEGIQQACPTGLMAVEHESFTEPPEIEVGAIGRWRNLTAENAGAHLTAQVRSLWWKSDEFKVQGWLLQPEHPDGQLPLVTIVHGGPAAAAVVLPARDAGRAVEADRRGPHGAATCR